MPPEDAMTPNKIVEAMDHLNRAEANLKVALFLLSISAVGLAYVVFVEFIK